MTYKNDLEGKLFQLERELSVAKLNNWEFDIANIKDEITDTEEELKRLEGE